MNSDIEETANSGGFILDTPNSKAVVAEMFQK
jgi:hypothetical protein